MTNRRDDALLRGFTFSMFTMMALMASYFPLYFQHIGYNTLQIGLIFSIGPMIGIVSNLFWGFMSDKYRTVKKIIILIVFGQLLVSAFLFQVDSFALLMITMSFLFFFQQPIISLNDSLTLLTISGTKKSYASFRVWGSIGFAAAALGFGMLLRSLGTDWTLWLAVGSLSVTLLLALLIKDARDAKVTKPDFSGLLPLVTAKPFLAFLVMILIVSMSHRMNDSFLALYMQHLGANPTLIGWAWMVSALSEIPIFFLLSKYGHRFKELPLLAVSSLVYALRFLLMSQAHDPMWIVVIQALHSFSFGIFLFTGIRYIQGAIPDQYRASGQAVFAITWSGLAGLLSGVTGGWIFNELSPQLMYETASLLAFSAMVGFIGLHYRNTRSGV
ncbi:MFS transporter [Paenibacillus sp. YYML68]|uniref:MFS transporter n=1 Tax=Paenibacillus sp. YYML68 TaxID=2909250 RepID=UPI002491039D|nr:MFS transporter [Paenibacillus sp. YYML68]